VQSRHEGFNTFTLYLLRNILGPDRRAVKGTSEGKLIRHALYLAAVTRSSKCVVIVSPAGDDRQVSVERVRRFWGEGQENGYTLLTGKLAHT
jgi:hypothetical protein